jgi:prepilin-type N-terminal cleavage/methylation domain-containing protein
MLMRRRAFTFIEVMIAVVLLGILAAVLFPKLRGQTIIARESSAKDSLNLMRTQIEFYKIDHDGIRPGYMDGSGVPTAILPYQFVATTTITGAVSPSTFPSTPYLYGPYIKKMPQNPFNDLTNIAYVAEATAFSDAVDGTSSGWLYKKETGEFKINWTGTDSEGVNFYDY